MERVQEARRRGERLGSLLVGGAEDLLGQAENAGDECENGK